MSSNDKTGAQDRNLAARNTSVSSHNPGAETDDMKRAAARELIEKYYFQLTDGCGKSNCKNINCASSPNFSLKNATKSEMAVNAIDLFRNKATLCEVSPCKVARPERSSDSALDTQPSSSKNQPSTASSETCTKNQPTKTTENLTEQKAEKNQPLQEAKVPKEIKYMTEEKLLSILEECKSAGSYSLLIRTIGEVFNNPESLKLSFRQSPIHKEEIRTMQGDLDKDKDEEAGSSVDEVDELANVRLADDPQVSPRPGSECDEIDVDIESVRRFYAHLLAIPDQPFQGALINALLYLSRSIYMDLRYNKPLDKDSNYINIFIIVMENSSLHSPEFVESAYPDFCKTVGSLPLKAQAKLARFWSRYSKERLCEMVQSLQQLITVKVINGEGTWTRLSSVSDDEGIGGAAKVLKILFYASIYGGKMDPDSVLEAEKNLAASEDPFSDLLQGAVGREPKESRQPKEDPLAKELNVNPINCKEPLVPYEDFVNEPLNDNIDIPTDYANYRVDESSKFSFVNHNFILTTASKHMSMYFDNRMRMLNERRTSWLDAIVNGDPSMPFLRLRVRRDHLIDDALVGLEMVAMEKPSDLKKQLFVEFEGEQGLDEGGVSKEFFQLVVEEMFNPDFGMFTYNEETQQFWFNPTSFENDGQFTLIGIVLGLAIYNSAILDVHFPMVVYRKLMGKLGTFQDLFDMDPVLYTSLNDILQYEGDVEETFLQTFCIGYHDVFGNKLSHNLKDKGSQIPVTNSNRQEFVDLYADFLLNKSIEKQFRAFRRGFQLVTDESPLKFLFRPEEVEVLVCGNKKFDFLALEQATDYDGGFTKTSQTVKDFWEVVHDFTEEEKKKLLQFTTGTDRVPVGGLEKLKLIIARNGPDSDRLPTSHTCFNVLLLPDYSSKDKLRERLLKAITYSKGFGML